MFPAPAPSAQRGTGTQNARCPRLPGALNVQPCHDVTQSKRPPTQRRRRLPLLLLTMEAAGREAVIGVTEAEPNSSPELILLVSSLIGSLQHVLHYHLLNDALLTQTRGQKIHTVASGSVDVT